MAGHPPDKPSQPAARDPWVLDVEDVHKTFGTQEVLRGLSLKVRRGETLVIIGRSGGGKSVLLKHILGLVAADSGSIRIDGEELCGLPERKLSRIRRKIGMLFQEGALFDSFNVAENVAFPLFEQGMKNRQEIFERVRDALHDVDLEAHMAKFPSNLSGGMRKRVALARAIVSRPDIILYDEPQSGLDPVITDSINLLIRRLQEKYRVTSLVVTHDMKSAYQIGDRIAYYRDGTIYFLGTPDELKANPDPIIQDFIQGRSRPEHASE
ncbi:MAG: ATP-binding cassette domain-containing protein [Verrucomicrobia bacterium]|nr:ATP-binding cassette domain-containing protein [Verrucomicrobiota bacterium]